MSGASFVFNIRMRETASEPTAGQPWYYRRPSVSRTDRARARIKRRLNATETGQVVDFMMSDSDLVKNGMRSGDPASLQDPGVIRLRPSALFFINIMEKT